MNKMLRNIAIVTLGIFLFSNTAFAQVSSNFWKLTGVALSPLSALWEIGSSGNRVAKIWVNALDATTIVSGGTAASPILLPDGTAGAPALSFSSDTDTGLYRVSANTLGFSSNGVSTGSWGPSSLAITQAAASSGLPTAFTVTAGAHTNETASSSVPDIYFNSGRTITYATGAQVDMSFVKIVPPTVAFAGASNVTGILASVEITGAPILGTNGSFSGSAASAVALKITAATGSTALTIINDANSIAHPGLQFTRTDGSSGSITLSDDSMVIGSYSTSKNTVIMAASTRAITVDNTQKVGIGPAITSPAATLDIQQQDSTSGLPVLLKIRPGTHTNLTASSGYNAVDINLNGSVQFATGDQQFVLGESHTLGTVYGTVAGSTIGIGVGATFFGAPQAGANVTLAQSATMVIGNGSSNAGSIYGEINLGNGIKDGYGNATEVSALLVGPLQGSTHLGNQTANLTTLSAIHLLAATYDSTTNTRTVTGDSANLLIDGPLASAGGVTMTSYAIKVKAGTSLFAGPVQETDTKNSGTCTLNGGATATCTATVLSGATCTANDTANPRAIQASVTATTATFTSGTALDTDVVAYSCH